MMESKFIGREIMDRPACPFCEAIISPPRDLPGKTLYNMPAGRCSCGAAYAFDITGHNLGSAMIEALVLCCGGNWDLAWEMLPDEDYVEGYLENYDPDIHRIIHGGVYKGRRIAGVLYFIKLQKDIKGLAEFRRPSEKEDVALPQRPQSVHRRDKAFLKKEVELLIRNYDIEPLIDMAGEGSRILRILQRLLYSPDKLTRLRTADIIGKVTAKISHQDPSAVMKFLQGLFTAVIDSASSSWGYPAAIGEIIGNSTDRFADFIPRIYLLARDRTLLPDILRSLGTIASVRPDLIRKNSFHFIIFTEDPDPEIRGNALILLGHLGATEFKDEIRKLLKDYAQIDVYREGELIKRTLSSIASEILEKPHFKSHEPQH